MFLKTLTIAALAAALAACSGGGNADSDGGDATDGSGGGSLDPDIDGGNGTDDPRIVERTTPVGFTNYDATTGQVLTAAGQ